MKNFYIGALVACLYSASVVAQERASGDTGAERNSIARLQIEQEKLESLLVTLQQDFAPIERCAAKGRIYARGTPYSDSDGCLDTSLMRGPKGERGDDGPAGAPGPQGPPGQWVRQCTTCCE